ncbi:MAG: WD40 repeat domain-containing protein, partial [Gammaproteobacteria bacterium]
KASIDKLKECLLTYSENLARLALNIGEGKINVNLTEQDTSHPSLVIPSPGQVPYFKEEPVAKQKLELIRSGCLLQTIGNHFKFLHKSLVEYFAAKVLFKGAHRTAASYLNRFDEHHSFKDLDLNEHLLTNEPSVIYLLADKAKEDIHFKYLLYQMIELSKGEPSVANAAANAITILNAAGESFSGRDFRGVHIAGALLNSALCDHVDFEGADINNVTAQHACLSHANLSHARVQGVDFQELPRIKHTSPITTCLVATSGQWLLVGDAKGYVTQYSYPAGKVLQQWYRKSQSLMGKALSLPGLNYVSALALHPNEKLAVCGGMDGTAQLIDIEHNRLGARFIPTVMKQAKLWHINFSFTSSMTFCSETGAYLAFSSIIVFVPFTDPDFDPEYDANHLQLWDIRQERFLGEYQTGGYNTINALTTCHRGQTLIAKQDKKILIFFIASYQGGDLVPAHTLDCEGPFSISQDGRLLAVVQKNAIQLYQTQEWQPLNTISLHKKLKELRTLTFSHQGDLLAGSTDTQLDFWDLSSAQNLYTLPIPEGKFLDKITEGDFDRVKRSFHFIPHCEPLRVTVAVNEMLYFWPLNRAAVSIAYPRRPIDLSTTFLEKTIFKDKIYNDDLEIKISEIGKGKTTIEYTLDIYHKPLQKTQQFSYHTYSLSDDHNQKLAISPDRTYLVTQREDNLTDIELTQICGIAGSIFIGPSRILSPGQ